MAKMFRFYFIFSFFVACAYSYIEHPGARFPATKGEVWPKPQNQQTSDQQMSVILDTFKFQITGESCTILTKALSRYLHIIHLQGGRKNEKRKKHRYSSIKNYRKNRDTSSLDVLEINLTSECEEWPSLGMNESYDLTINTHGELKSDSIWGILRGLETFSQLVHIENPLTNDLFINQTAIHDFPRFSHRGLLLDTSRHFISLPTIRQVLRGMTYNKLNVFHWHIVDDQSFPYESIQFPNLSKMGAFHPKLVYSQEDVEKIVEYARIRGIRVMVEFDTPGHTRSWGVAYPELLTKCYGHDGKPNGDLGPIDPTNEFVYKFLSELFKEVVNVFPDQYLHLGGDEVDFDCWESNPHIKDYMKAKNISNFHQLEEMYIQRVVDIVNNEKSNSVVWQEVYLNGVKLPKGTVVHAWTGNQEQLLDNITANGLPALLSTCWYLDHLTTGGDWKKFYTCDPHDFPGTDQQKKLILGGEACMWGEVIDNGNVLARIFPRASATAEKLWSAMSVDNITEATYRLEEQYCRMNKRGYPAQPPSGPGFCI